MGSKRYATVSDYSDRKDAATAVTKTSALSGHVSSCSRSAATTGARSGQCKHALPTQCCPAAPTSCMLLAVLAWPPLCFEHCHPAVSVATAAPGSTWGKVHKYTATLPGRYVTGCFSIRNARGHLLLMF
jgi:hypothetical protein